MPYPSRMTRYAKGHKDTTRQRIVELASERFRKDGIDGVGVASIMADAGLTHGGFYAHFGSKEDLVEEAVTHAFKAIPKDDGEDPQAFLARFIDWYLSPGHRDHPERGCPMAALGPDLARKPKAVRTAMSKVSVGTIDVLAAALSTVPEVDRTSTAQAIMAQLLGSIQLARVASTKEASAKILDMGKRIARQLAGLRTD